MMAPRLASTMGTIGVPLRCWHPAWLTCAAPVSARSARMSKTIGGRYDWGATPVLAPCLAAACRAGNGTQLHVRDNNGTMGAALEGGRCGSIGVPRRWWRPARRLRAAPVSARSSSAVVARDDGGIQTRRTFGATGVPRRCWHPAWLLRAAPVSARSFGADDKDDGWAIWYVWGATPVMAPLVALSPLPFLFLPPFSLAALLHPC